VTAVGLEQKIQVSHLDLKTIYSWIAGIGIGLDLSKNILITRGKREKFRPDFAGGM
jgi:hypothetical protein